MEEVSGNSVLAKSLKDQVILVIFSLNKLFLFDNIKHDLNIK